MKECSIWFSCHARRRLAERSRKLGLDDRECAFRVEQALIEYLKMGRPETCNNKLNIRRYFSDNITVNAICLKKKNRIKVITVILRRGRE